MSRKTKGRSGDDGKGRREDLAGEGLAEQN